MTITVKDLFKYNPDFEVRKVQYLTGKKEFKETDTVNLSRLAGLNNKGLSIWAAEKEGKPFINSIKDDKMKAQVVKASGIKIDNEETQNVPAHIPMDKSVFDFQDRRQVG